MSLEDLIRNPLMNIRPFDGLEINATVWGEAHAQHHTHRYLHALGAHKPGILSGLEVTAPKGNVPTLVVTPGVAVDAAGQTIIVSEVISRELTGVSEWFLTLSFAPQEDKEVHGSVAGGKGPYKFAEGYALNLQREPPSGLEIELARVNRSGAEQPIREAASPFNPQDDEINLLFRPMASPACFVDAQIGELSYVGADDDAPGAWRPNRAGLWHLMREGNGCGFHLSPTPFAPEEPDAPQPTLLYVAGRQAFQPFSDGLQDGLLNYLGRGGFLFGEACREDQGFEEAFLKLFERLGAKLNPVASSHPLLTSHHVFSAPPAGARGDGTLRIDRKLGVLFSSYDYGGAWQGEVPDPKGVDARERIRQAQEFGLNIIAFAAHRRRQIALAAQARQL